MPTAEKRCFVIMPFGEEGTEEHERNWKIYFQIIKPVVTACGYIAKRADELEYLGNITHDIIEWLYQSQLVIADLSGKNANVFYELGVRHALLRAGTIPIMRKGEKPPFDIANYRTIFYSIELDGPASLQQKLKNRIQAFESQQENRCDNPVHETLGSKIPQVDVLHQQQATIETLQSKVDRNKSIIATLQAELAQQASQWSQAQAHYEQQLTDAEAKRRKLQENFEQLTTQYTALETKTSQLTQQKAKLEQQIVNLNQQIQEPPQNKPPVAPPVRKPPLPGKPRFRSEPQPLSEDDVNKMFKTYDFFDSNYNKNGQGFKHQFEPLDLKGEKVIFDKASGLMWQQSGSENEFNFNDAKAYIEKLNTTKFAGCNDWRLPTLEEAMSLMEPKKNKAGLYIDERFDSMQRWIWTADEYGGSARWCVSFNSGGCDRGQIVTVTFVRAVRFGRSSPE